MARRGSCRHLLACENPVKHSSSWRNSIRLTAVRPLPHHPESFITRGNRITSKQFGRNPMLSCAIRGGVHSSLEQVSIVILLRFRRRTHTIFGKAPGKRASSESHLGDGISVFFSLPPLYAINRTRNRPDIGWLAGQTSLRLWGSLHFTFFPPSLLPGSFIKSVFFFLFFIGYHQ